MKVILILLLATACSCFTYNKIADVAAHTSLVTTASFFLDGNRWVTGSKDNTVQVWTTLNSTMLWTHTFPDEITNVALHPVDNRIFVVCFDGSISVYNPTTYALITTFNHPTGNGNYLIFNGNPDTFFLGGYDGSGVAPSLYKFSSVTYTQISSFVTNFPVGDQINTLSLNPSRTHIAITNLATNITTYKLSIYKLSDNSLINTFTHYTGNLKWAIYHNTLDFVCATSSDLNIKCYTYDNVNNIYVQNRTWIALAFPYCIDFGIVDTMIVTEGPSIYFYNLLNTTTTPAYYILTDSSNIFVQDSVSNMSYLITGKQNGHVSIWQYVAAPTPPTPTPTTNLMTNLTSPSYIGMIVGIVLGAIILIFIVAMVIYCRCCGGWAKWKKNKQEQDQFFSVNIVRPEMATAGEQVIVIKDDDQEEDEDLDYDQLMANGTVIVIKDEEKKRKYLMKINKKQGSGGSLRVEGDIIIIRDDDHPLKNHKNTHEDKSDTDSEVDFAKLMTEGSVIIIRDEKTRKKFQRTMKQSNPNFKLLEAEGTVVIIRGDDERKKCLKELAKDRDMRNIRHDQVLVNGDMLVIRDLEKKREFAEDLRKKLSSLGKLDPKKEADLQALEVAEQIIIIRGDDDEDEDPSYEQLMAEGVVIVIKDEEIISDYAEYVKKSKKAKKTTKKTENVSEKSSEADYEMLMAEEHIVVIKEDDDRRDYVQFIKQRKNQSEKSSNISYDELIKGGNMAITDENQRKPGIKKKSQTQRNLKKIDVMQERDQPSAQQQSNHLMAERNVLMINEEGEFEVNQDDYEDSKNPK